MSVGLVVLLVVGAILLFKVAAEAVTDNKECDGNCDCENCNCKKEK